MFAAVRKLSRLLGAPPEQVAPTTQPEAAKKASEASPTPGGSSAPQKEASESQSSSKQVASKKMATGQKRGREDEPSQPGKKPTPAPAQRPLLLTSGGPVHLRVGSAEEHAEETPPPSLWHFRHVACDDPTSPKGELEGISGSPA